MLPIQRDAWEPTHCHSEYIMAGTNKMQLRLPAKRYKTFGSQRVIQICCPKRAKKGAYFYKFSTKIQHERCSAPRSLNHLAPRGLSWLPEALIGSREPWFSRLPGTMVGSHRPWFRLLAPLLRYHTFLMPGLCLCVIVITKLYLTPSCSRQYIIICGVGHDPGMI